MMKKFSLFAVLFTAALLGAESIEFNTKADFARGTILAGSNCLRSFVPGVHVESKKFAVDTQKKYRLSGEFRAGKNSGGKIESLYFGFVPFDADGKQIMPENVRPVNTGIFTLVQDVKAGDKVLKIKGDHRIINTPFIMAAFDAKGDLSDLPNYDLSPRMNHKTVKFADGIITVELIAPMTFDRPAGTPVRFHSLDAMHIYTVGKITPDAQWQKFSGEISGSAVRGVPYHQWWHGTKSAAAIFRYVGKAVQCEVEFRNIKVETIE